MNQLNCCKELEPYIQSFSDQLLLNPPPDLVFTIFASRDYLKSHEGCDKKYIRSKELSPAKKPIDTSCCAIYDKPCCFEWTYSTVKAQFYGCYTPLEIVCTLQSILPKVQNAVDKFKRQIRSTEDWLTGQMLKANASVYYARYGTNGDFPTDITARDVMYASNIVLTHGAQYVTEGQRGECRFNTNPLGPSLVGYIHMNLKPDLTGLMPLFTKRANYPNPDEALPSELGAVEDVRFIGVRGETADDALITPDSSRNGNDVYDIPIFGQNAYLILEMEDQDLAPSLYFRDPGGPYPTCRWLSWMMSFGTGIINENFIINLKVTEGKPIC